MENRRELARKTRDEGLKDEEDDAEAAGDGRKGSNVLFYISKVVRRAQYGFAILDLRLKETDREEFAIYDLRLRKNRWRICVKKLKN